MVGGGKEKEAPTYLLYSRDWPEHTTVTTVKTYGP
jgi:hypothetical protein